MHLLPLHLASFNSTFNSGLRLRDIPSAKKHLPSDSRAPSFFILFHFT